MASLRGAGAVGRPDFAAGCGVGGCGVTCRAGGLAWRFSVRGSRERAGGVSRALAALVAERPAGVVRWWFDRAEGSSDGAGSLPVITCGRKTPRRKVQRQAAKKRSFGLTTGRGFSVGS